MRKRSSILKEPQKDAPSPALANSLMQFVTDFQFSLSIRPLSHVMVDFSETLKAVRGRRVPKGPRGEVGFTSIEAARNSSTRERPGLRRTIRTRHPSSLPRLQECAGRYSDPREARSGADRQTTERQVESQGASGPF